MSKPSSRRDLLRHSLNAGAVLFLGNALAGGAGAWARTAVGAGGFDPQRLDRIRQAMQGWVDQGIIAGAVTLLYRRGTIAHTDVIGWQDEAARIPLRRDTIFRIASMSKPITCLAAMMLIEEGRLRLEDSIAQWIPELAHPRVLLDPAGPLEQSRPAVQPITVRHLMTHTAGLASPVMTSGSLAQRVRHLFSGVYGRIAQPVPRDQWLAELGSLPLFAEPGTQSLYGLSIDVLGLLIGRVSGVPFEEFLAQRIFEPLDMRDTAFVVPPEKKQRLAVGYAYDEASGNRIIGDSVEQTGLTKPLIFPAGGGGLVSTIDDYLQVCRVLLGRGEVDGTRLVSRAAADLMTHKAAGPDFIATTRPGMSMTLGGGIGVVTDAGAQGSLLPEGSMMMGGSYGTGACIIPREEMVALYMIQLLGGPAETIIRPTFPNLAVQAIAD